MTNDSNVPSDSPKVRDPILRLTHTLDYVFKNERLLLEALTHRSFVNESNDSTVKDNERLEFLGDAVLDLVVSTELVERFPHAREGTMSRIRASMVSEGSLADLARSIELGDCLRLGKGEALSGGRTRSSLLSDAFEAVIAAVYLDSSIEETARVLSLLLKYPEKVELRSFDAKTYLQEVMQSKWHLTPYYRLVSESGPDHEKTFVVAVLCGAETLSQGSGRTKKEAEQAAADSALSSVDWEKSPNNQSH